MQSGAPGPRSPRPSSRWYIADTGREDAPIEIQAALTWDAVFATPLGYQTNTLVYGAGNYHFGDFTRVGLPLNLIMGAVAVGLIPLFWPF